MVEKRVLRTGLLLRLEGNFILVKFLCDLLRLLVVDWIGTGYDIHMSAPALRSTSQLQAAAGSKGLWQTYLLVLKASWWLF